MFRNVSAANQSENGEESGEPPPRVGFGNRGGAFIFDEVPDDGIAAGIGKALSAGIIGPLAWKNSGESGANIHVSVARVVGFDSPPNSCR